VCQAGIIKTPEGECAVCFRNMLQGGEGGADYTISRAKKNVKEKGQNSSRKKKEKGT